MSSCPKECGPRGDIIPTLKPDEEPADLIPKPHYSCFNPADTSPDRPEKEAENVASGKSQFKDADDTACEKPKEDSSENENKSCDKTEEEEVEKVKAAAREDDDGKQKQKEVEHSSLFNIADAKSDDVDRMRISPPNALEEEKLLQKNHSQRSSNAKSPRELLQPAMLPPATLQ